jgi:photosystem II stability/assembly factor-like uncharacterized protein
MTHSRSLGPALGLLIALIATGCGSSSIQVVDSSRGPHIAAFAVNPKDGSMLLATNRGLYAIDGSKATPVRSEVRVKRETGRFGTKVSSFAFTGPDRLVGSGHPDSPTLPGSLGLIESSDDGRSWTAVSRVGLSDLHVIESHAGTLVAYDTTLGATIVSRDGGKAWSELSTPAPTVIDIAVDPSDPTYLIASTGKELSRSTNQGRGWKSLGRAAQAELAWGSKGLFRADHDGTVLTSNDRGSSWSRVGKLDRSPGKLTETSDGMLYAALDDGSIQRSEDGGRDWKTVFGG